MVLSTRKITKTDIYRDTVFFISIVEFVVFPENKL